MERCFKMPGAELYLKGEDEFYVKTPVFSPFGIVESKIFEAQKLNGYNNSYALSDIEFWSMDGFHPIEKLEKEEFVAIIIFEKYKEVLKHHLGVLCLDNKEADIIAERLYMNGVKDKNAEMILFYKNGLEKVEDAFPEFLF